MARIKVIHLEIDGEHYYFGSLKALHEFIGPERMGMKFNSFHSNVRVSPEAPYVNRRKGYIIREGVLVQTKTNRRSGIAALAMKEAAAHATAAIAPVQEPAKPAKQSKKKTTDAQQLDLFGL